MNLNLLTILIGRSNSIGNCMMGLIGGMVIVTGLSLNAPLARAEFIQDPSTGGGVSDKKTTTGFKPAQPCPFRANGEYPIGDTNKNCYIDRYNQNREIGRNNGDRDFDCHPGLNPSRILTGGADGSVTSITAPDKYVCWGKKWYKKGDIVPINPQLDLCASGKTKPIQDYDGSLVRDLAVCQ